MSIRLVHLRVFVAITYLLSSNAAVSTAGEVGYRVVLEDFAGAQLPVDVVFDDTDLISRSTIAGQYAAVAGGFDLLGERYRLTGGLMSTFASPTASQVGFDLQFLSASGETAQLQAFLATPFGDATAIVLADDRLPNPFPEVSRFTGMRSFRLMIGTAESMGLVVSVNAVEAGDTTPPEVLVQVRKSSIWPPNGKLVDVGLDALVMDDQDDAPAVDLYVFSDEADKDARKKPDATNVEPGKLQLRAERLGQGDGRVFLILLIATDAAGNVGADCCTVVVQHDKSTASLRRVEQQAADAVAACLEAGEVPDGYQMIAARSW